MVGEAVVPTSKLNMVEGAVAAIVDPTAPSIYYMLIPSPSTRVEVKVTLPQVQGIGLPCKMT